MSEKRSENRRDFSYYMQLTDAATQTPVGHLADISSGGFKLDCDKPIPVDQNFSLRLNLTKDISDKQFMVFQARSKWCHADPIDPFVFNVGFHIVDIHPGDLDIFIRVAQLYGKNKPKRNAPPPRGSSRSK